MAFYNNKLIALGSSSSSDGDLINNKGQRDVWIVTFDTSGNLINSRSFGGSEIDLGNSFIVSDEFIILVSDTRSNDGDIKFNKGEADFWILILTHDLKIVNSRTFGGSEADYPSSILYTKSKKIIVAGNTNSEDGDTPLPEPDDIASDGWLLVLDTNLIIRNNCRFGNKFYDAFESVCLNNEGSICLSGNTNVSYLYDSSVITSDYWLVVMSNLAGIENEIKESDIEVYLVDRNLIIKSVSDNLKIKSYMIFTVDGKLVLSKENINSDFSEFSMSHLVPGVYIVEVISNIKMRMKILLK